MDIRAYLRNHDLGFQTLLHPPVPFATKFAQSLHIPGRLVAKGVLLKAKGTYYLAVLPATTRIDLGRLAEILETDRLEVATEDEVERVFDDCERGAIPPFGRPYGLTTIVDASLANAHEIVVMANTRHEAFRLRYRDYEALEAPIVAHFATATHTRRAG